MGSTYHRTNTNVYLETWSLVGDHVYYYLQNAIKETWVTDQVPDEFHGRIIQAQAISTISREPPEETWVAPDHLNLSYPGPYISDL
jgi:hypothetical protein